MSSSSATTLIDESSTYVVHGADMPLSDTGLADVLKAALARDAGLRFTARGFSMHPFISDGDAVTVSPVVWEKVRVGHVVACRDDSGLFVHRVIRRLDSRCLVRGDNCESPDGLVAPAEVIGRVTVVERRGRRVRLAVGPAGRPLAALSRRGWLRPAVALVRHCTRRARGRRPAS